MSDNHGTSRGPDDLNFDLDAIIRADEEDKRKEDALLTSAKKKEDNKKKFFLGAIGLALVGTVTSLFILNPFGIGENKDDPKSSEPTSSVSAPANPENNGQGPDANSQQPFWTEKGKQWPPAANGVPLQEWQTQNGESYKNLPTEEEQKKAKAELSKNVAAYNISVPGVNSNLQSLPSRSNGFTDDPSKVTLEDGSLNPKYSYWTLEGFNENVNYQLQRFVNPVFGGWQEYQYSSSKGLTVKDAILTDRFTGSYEPTYLDSMKDKPLNTWLPIYADWNHNDYGMGDQLLPEPAPRWLGSLDNVETTFTFNEAAQSYSAHVKANVTYVAWSQSQKTLTKTGVIEFDVTSGTDEKSIRYMLSNSKLEMKA